MSKQPSWKRVLTDPKHPKHFVVSDFLALVTIVSVVSIVLETVPELAAWSAWFLAIEWITVAIFSLEYLCRVWAVEKKTAYIFSWFGIIDLVSIVPTYLGLGNFTFLKTARVIRLMRLLRILRITKMRSLRSRLDHDTKLSFYAINVLIFLTVLLSATLLIGILIYIVEGNRVAFDSIPNGMWWAFRIFTNDPTFIQTETVGGEIVYVLSRVVGLIVFGTLIGVISNVFKKSLFGDK